MLSTITPFGERSRGHRYRATAAWFVAGGVAGGLTLGGAAAGLAWMSAATGLSARPDVVAAVGVVIALAAASVDAGLFGPVLPVVRRQVDDRWLVRYRRWFYAAGFGWQVGVGFATYVMTAGVLLLVVLAALSGTWWVAVALGGAFGLARGLTVLLTAFATDPAGLRALHAKLDRYGPVVRYLVVALSVATAVVLAGSRGLPVGAAVAASAAALGGAVVGVRALPRRRRSVT
jgi:hypothetical protein